MSILTLYLGISNHSSSAIHILHQPRHLRRKLRRYLNRLRAAIAEIVASLGCSFYQYFHGSREGPRLCFWWTYEQRSAHPRDSGGACGTKFEILIIFTEVTSLMGRFVLWTRRVADRGDEDQGFKYDVRGA